MVMIPLTMDTINQTVASFFAIPMVVPALGLIIGLALASFLWHQIRQLFEG